MSDPTTRPGEMAKYREIASDPVEARMSMMISLARMEEWMKSHDARDNERFAALEQRMGRVTSGVNAASAFRTRLDGIKTGVMFILGVIGLIVSAIWAAATFWWDHK